MADLAEAHGKSFSGAGAVTWTMEVSAVNVWVALEREQGIHLFENPHSRKYQVLA